MFRHGRCGIAGRGREVWVVAALGGAVACTAPVQGPDLGRLYSRAASDHGPHRNPVVVIPGILGSRLVDADSGCVVWGAFGGGSADPTTGEGARLVAVPMQEGAALAELRDAVQPAGVLDRVRLDLLGVPVQLNAYANILATLGAGGYRDEQLGRAGAVDYGDDHFTCFQFAYDWRRDNVESARALGAFLKAKREYVREQIRRRYGVDRHDLKFDLVAHSMGGLVARYYLMYGDAEPPADDAPPAVTWAGASLVERAILIGTPNAGSAHAVRELINGSNIGPFLPTYSPAIVGTMPAVYQLLPRTRHGAVVRTSKNRPVDVFDATAWEANGWGLASPAQDAGLRLLLPEVLDPAMRRRIALDHQRKCLVRAAQFTRALDVAARLPAGLELHLFAGDAVPTDAVVCADGEGGGVRAVRQDAGDGTVLRSSALLDERVGGEWSGFLDSPIAWTHVTFLFHDHLGLTKSPSFADNVLHLLLERPRRGTN